MTQYARFLKELLAPLGVYDLAEGSINESELHALGAGLDTVSDELEYVQREAFPATAETEGLTRREALFARRPAAETAELRRAAITALLRIDGDSLTPADIDRTLSGCGIRAKAQETGRFGHLRVIFPDVPGVPEGFEQLGRIILDILPCHMETEFYFRYLLWEECEKQGLTWADVEAAGHTWESFQLAVPPEE